MQICVYGACNIQMYNIYNTYIHTYIDTYIHLYMHEYIHTYAPYTTLVVTQTTLPQKCPGSQKQENPIETALEHVAF